MKSFVLLFAGAAGIAGLPITASAQVCTESSPGVAQIQTGTPTTTLKLVGAVVKANAVSCGFAATSIVVVGQPGNETVVLSTIPASIPVSTQLGAGKNTVHVYATAGNDTIVCGAVDVDRDGDGTADLAFDALPTALRIYGKTGDDVVDCSAFSKGVGIVGAEGTDDLTGSNFDDAIDGGPDADVIHAGAGNDEITPGLGDDQAWGGAGKDTFTAGKTFDGNDQLEGEAGVDNINYGARTSTVIVGGAGSEDAISDDTETIKGGKGDDTIDLSSATLAHTLLGGLGNDSLRGGSAKDVIDAGDGNDSIGPAADGFVETIKCGTGTDTYVDNGEDVFVGCETPGSVGVGAASTMVGGDGHACALLSGGTVKCWGYNGYGELGLGHTDHIGDNPGEMGNALLAVDLGTGRTATAIAAGWYHTCAILDTGAVKCWGYNGSGQLGLGDTSGRGVSPGQMGDALPALDLGTGRTAVAIEGGGMHTCAILDNGAVKCWGENWGAQLGVGDVGYRGDNPGEMGDALSAVDLGTGRTAVAISADYHHTCAVLDNGDAKCWGYGDYGALGQGDTGWRGDQPGEMGDALPAIDLGTGRTATAIAAGHVSSCALLDNGGVKCWGMNWQGQLGQGDNISRGLTPGQLGDALPTVDLGTGRTATAISMTIYHVCAILDDTTTKCWGSGGNGELGLNDNTHRGDQPGEMGDALPAIDLGTGRSATAVLGAFFSTCARLDDATLKCWGQNWAGQLGQGDTMGRGDNAGEMGDGLLPIDLGGVMSFAPEYDDADGDAAPALADIDVSADDDDVTADELDDADDLGGCSTSRGGGSLATGVLLGLALMLRRRTRS